MDSGIMREPGRIRLKSVFFLTLICLHGVFGQTDTLSLSGSWSFRPTGSAATTLQVPGFYVWKLSPKASLSFPTTVTGPWKIVEGKPEATYETTFHIPSAFAGKRIFLRFESVNFLADIFINGTFVSRQIGGYLPFEIDITNHIEIPSHNSLRVDIKYWDPAFLNSAQKPLWPVGFYDNFWCLGITGDVSVIARNPVYVENLYLRTSVTQWKIDAVVTLVNADTTAHTVVLENRIEGDGSPVLSWNDQSIALSAGDTLEIPLSQAWGNPDLWWPDDPRLYRWVSRVRQDGVLRDERSERFGFREFRIQGKHFSLNGVRTNLRGDNITIHGEKQYWIYLTPTPEAWAAILDSMKALNFNVIRLHHSPPPRWMLDLCDEKGMMAVGESALMWRNEVTPYQSPQYTINGAKWQKKWVREYRNHPSIILWSAANEMYVWGQICCSRTQLITFASAIREMDTTRPILFEGDWDLDGYAEIMSYHYIYGYPKGWPGGNIYTSLSGYVHSTKPSSYGEFEWWSAAVSAAQHVRRQGAMARASRIVGFSDIRPYRLDWTWHPNPNYTDIYDPTFRPSPHQKAWIRNAFNPVAVFDKSFYENRVDEWTPVYNENDLITRTLVIFNDDRQNTEVDVHIKVWLDNALSEKQVFSVDIPLGDHIERDVRFRAPFVSQNRSIRVELNTYKNGVQRFTERYVYWIQNRGLSPPDRVQHMTLLHQPDGLDITWPAVTRDLFGGPETIDRYVLYRSTDCFAATAGADSFVIRNQTRHADNWTAHIGNPDLNAYYRIRAVDNTQLISDWSDIYVSFDYALKTGGGTNFTHIAVPVDDPNLRDAKALLERIPTSKSVIRWDAAHQGYEQYVPGLPNTNFPVEPGEPCWVHTVSDTVADFTGKIAEPAYTLYPVENGTGFHAVMLPLDCGDLATASALMESIGKCNGIAKWDPVVQGYIQFDPSVPGSDFPARPGYPYLVHVTDDVVWPASGQAGKSVPRERVRMASDFSRAPHLVWGETAGDGREASAAFRAFIAERPEAVLTHESPGSSLSRDRWAVQCAAFPDGWRAGETLVVDLTDSEGKDRRFRTVLSWNPSDRADGVTEREHGRPESPILTNHPNPFNGRTLLRFDQDGPSHVLLDILNPRGRRVARLVDRRMEAGTVEVSWDARDDLGRPVSAGLYLARLRAESRITIRKMILTN
ncbi:MAG TPA: hypothetical protein ENN17_04570 [bacterium]|nr:hypothetical protein [bacterium]